MQFHAPQSLMFELDTELIVDEGLEWFVLELPVNIRGFQVYKRNHATAIL